MSERLRIGVYVLVLVAGGVAVGFGIVDAGQVDQWVAIIAGLIGVGGAGTALKHVRPATTQTVVAVQDVIDALGAQPKAQTTMTVTAPKSRAELVRQRYGA